MKKKTITVGGMALAVGLALLAAAPPAAANNIAVTNVVLVNQQAANQTVDVQFDLRWDNSWRTVLNTGYPAYQNWDAAWVFVKFQAPGSNTWQHARLSATSGNHSPAANSTIDAVPDGMGVFVYRASGYTGDVSYTGTRLRWNYGANGYNFAKGASVAVSVQAIEMVYVPQGAFWAGNTNGIINSSFHALNNDNAPVYIADANAFTIYAGAGSGAPVAVPGTFPNGFNAFYCMKYEISQGQYCDFLNKLTSQQAGIRWPSASMINRFTIGTNTVGAYTVDAPDRACNYLSWPDGCAYAAWAGLRPMTELEFEKACRGPVAPAAGEYAWGDSNTIVNLAFEINDGYGNSTPLPTNANSLTVGGELGPCRVGIFATANSTRQSAGASFWGIMELSGNLWERCVTVGAAHGLAFAASLGSGMVNSASGNATNADWYVADASGSGFRGGSWYSANTTVRVADRTKGATADPNRFSYYGWRGVRDAPSGVGP